MLHNNFGWIKAVLTNDENSSDAELVEYLIQNGISADDAAAWVARREDFMGRI